MILIDVNLLIYARNIDCLEHERAREWLDEQLSGSGPVGLPWPTLLGFLRVTTNPRAFERPLETGEAWDQIRSWLSADPVWIPQPTDRHTELLGDLLARSRAYGNLVHDAHLAALATEHGLTLCSTDGDFARFPRLKWLNPLAA